MITKEQKLILIDKIIELVRRRDECICIAASNVFKRESIPGWSYNNWSYLEEVRSCWPELAVAIARHGRYLANKAGLTYHENDAWRLGFLVNDNDTYSIAVNKKTTYRVGWLKRFKRKII